MSSLRGNVTLHRNIVTLHRNIRQAKTIENIRKVCRCAPLDKKSLKNTSQIIKIFPFSLSLPSSLKTRRAHFSIAPQFVLQRQKKLRLTRGNYLLLFSSVSFPAYAAHPVKSRYALRFAPLLTSFRCSGLRSLRRRLRGNFSPGRRWGERQKKEGSPPCPPPGGKSLAERTSFGETRKCPCRVLHGELFRGCRTKLAFCAARRILH